jgi:hypothetical protein
MGKSRRAVGVLLASARHLVHAFAQAGYSPPAQELQLFLGPNGALMWTDVAQARLPEWSSVDPLTSPDVVVLATSQPRADRLLSHFYHIRENDLKHPNQHRLRYVPPVWEL